MDAEHLITQVCCSVLYCVTVRCSVLQRVAVQVMDAEHLITQVCCSVLQCVAVRCIALQSVSTHRAVSFPTSGVLQCAAV